MASVDGPSLLSRAIPHSCGETLAFQLQNRQRLVKQGDDVDEWRDRASQILNQQWTTYEELDRARAALAGLESEKRQRTEDGTSTKGAHLQQRKAQQRVEEALAKDSKRQLNALQLVYKKARAHGAELDPAQAIIQQADQSAKNLALLFQNNIIPVRLGEEHYFKSWRDGYNVVGDAFAVARSAKNNVGLAGDVIAFEVAMQSTEFQDALLSLHRRYQELRLSFDHCFRRARSGAGDSKHCQVSISSILHPYGVQCFEACSAEEMPALVRVGLRLNH